METLVLVVHVLSAIGVIGLVLLQHGKGADMGAAFGSGASGSLFGVSGSSNFMSRATAICVVVFFSASLSLAYISGHREEAGSVVKSQANSATVSSEETAADAAPADSSAADVVPE
ncbi:MAG: preprotein translocase subunit SecG [Betaproteobacteria bacterium HGW-Betaproteobacteria-8]|nr:MAG: preprotein translocase subunit SecG [Betaproteobacteria bacterium HGW-Betaproteobacteria-8]